LERRLTTILAADVVGYSRLMGEDEAGTLAALKALRRDLVKPKEIQYGGRTVKLMGDGALMEFSNVVDAVQFAVEVQVAIAERNVEIPEDQRIIYRMGINIGDIIVEGDDIYGDGVNVAARLEGLCDPGGVCIARNVFNQVKGKLELTFEHLGEKEVKNIAEPVTVYRVTLDDKAAALVTPVMQGVTKPKRPWWPLGAAAVAVLVLAVGGALWWHPWAPDVEPASVENMAFPLPEKPSIAVLPFANMSDDPAQEYFADGMTEDLITDLSKISGLFVIARNSAFTYKGKTVKVRQVAKDLGVRYVLEGSVRRVGEEVRINAQLIDATTGGHLWADRYDGTLADVFDLQDKVTERIVDALALELTPQEVQRVGGPGTDNVEAHDAYLLGLTFYYRRTPESFAKAKTHFEQAIELDPNYSAAHTALAKMYAQSTIEAIAYPEALGVPWRAAAAKARRSLTKVQGQPNADVHVVRSWLALKRHQHKRAIAEAELALELNPNDVEALETLAKAQIYAGQPKAGIELAERAMRQSPTLLARPFLLMGLAEFALGNPDKAAEHIERAFELGSGEIDYAAILAAAYGKLGHIDQAKAAFDNFRQGYVLDHSPNVAQSMGQFQFSDPSVLERLAEGLKLAGVRVGIGGYLPLHEMNRLSGAEIEALLSGREIEGRELWSDRAWQRRQTADGAVEYSGFQIQPGVPWKAIGIARIEDDMLCEEWSGTTEPLELCSVIFRMPDGEARIRWDDFVIVTDTGPQPFKLVE
jgi:TolB-like protein/class 3 adenylate cyclase/Flp pilus assembly protein TadD